MKRQMQDTSLGATRNIALGTQDYDTNIVLYPNVTSEEAQNDLLKNSIRYVDYAGSEVENFGRLGNYGVGQSRFDDKIVESDIPYLQNIRASRQGPIAQFGSFLNQAIVGELIGGTIEGIGYLGELNEFNDL